MDIKQVDRLEGVFKSLTDSALVLESAYAGSVTVPRAQVRRLEVLGTTERVVLDPFRGDDPRRRIAHRNAPCPVVWLNSCNPARISASSAALSPSRRAAAATAPNASARR